MNQRLTCPALLSRLFAMAITSCLATPRVALAQACTPDFELVPSPNAEPQNRLDHVAVIADDDVWAVGFSFAQGFTVPYNALIEHWDGVRWAIALAPNPPVLR